MSSVVSFTYTLYLFMIVLLQFFLFFFFNDTATTEIYTLSLHDALPIYGRLGLQRDGLLDEVGQAGQVLAFLVQEHRSEEHTSELQSPDHLVCRLLLEKKKYRSRTRRRSSRGTAD